MLKDIGNQWCILSICMYEYINVCIYAGEKSNKASKRTEKVVRAKGGSVVEVECKVFMGRKKKD